MYVISGGQVAKCGTGCSIPANRAYINMTTVPEFGVSAPGVRYLEMPLAPENATSLEDIKANETAVKFVDNGQLFIKKNGIIYDVTGRKIR